ncbi:hypothetical protein [Pseudomonas sp. LFM046]|uniref:hypothetical protein n=1 Tax=Pseudomonas sp. LFM046 TaxID=1608357 RepID=UPI0005CFD5B4|nr:hypothetical protein [Pseudomonas sp. LFM046]
MKDSTSRPGPSDVFAALMDVPGGSPSPLACRQTIRFRHTDEQHSQRLNSAGSRTNLNLVVSARDLPVPGIPHSALQESSLMGLIASEADSINQLPCLF